MNRDEMIEKMSQAALIMIIFNEKKNYNTKEKKDSEMIKIVKDIIEREVKKNGIQ